MVPRIPNEPWDVFIARISASAFILSEPEQKQPNKAKRKKKQQRRGRALSIPIQHMEQLLDVASGAAQLVSVRGEVFTVKKGSIGHQVRGVAEGSSEHTVFQGVCSCEDCRFRNRRCKHMEAVDATSAAS